METDSEYRVILRGQEFTLTKSQIEFDSPNYFTSCFLGNFREAETRQLKMSRDPDLFKIIMDYLCGYQVLPLSEQVIPPRMSPELAVLNLRADASFYLLEGLVKECDKCINPKSKLISLGTPYLVLGCTGRRDWQQDISAYIDSLLQGKTHPWRTRVSQSQIDEGPLADLERVVTCTDYAALRTVAAVERFIRAHFPDYDSSGRSLVGWHTKELHRDRDYAWSNNCEFMVVLK